MSDPITATELERQGDAFIATFSAYLYPSDVEVRFAAMEACNLVGVDYIETVAHIVETAQAARPDVNIHPDAARYAAAMHFLDNVATLRSQGHKPREGISANGSPTDPLGRDAAPATDPDDYGSLA